MPKGNILSNKFNIIVNDQVYSLYTHSFLYFGVGQVVRRIFENECLCRGYSGPNCTPCVNDVGYTGVTVASACLLKDDERTYNIKVDGKDYNVKLIGTGQVDRCAMEMEYLFRPHYT